MVWYHTHFCNHGTINVNVIWHEPSRRCTHVSEPSYPTAWRRTNILVITTVSVIIVVYSSFKVVTPALSWDSYLNATYCLIDKNIDTKPTNFLHDILIGIIIFDRLAIVTGRFPSQNIASSLSSKFLVHSLLCSKILGVWYHTPRVTWTETSKSTLPII